MSVLNIHFAPDAVHLLSDTLVYAEGKPIGLCERKVEVAPSGRFAWSTRGLCRLGDAFDPLAGQCSTVDEAEVVALAWIEAVTDDDLAGSKGIEVTVAGYSDRAADLVVLQLTRERGKPVEASTYGRGVHLLPTSRNLPPLPATVTETQFIRLAVAQWKIRDRLDGSLCIGGLQHITTITQAGALQRIVGLYPDYAEHAGMLGDPNETDVGAFLGVREWEAA